MTVANFSSSLISDSTRANEIDDKVMLLLTNIVRILAQDSDGGGTWDTDHDVLQPIFDWYESGASEGCFSTVRMRGSATVNGIRIRDMVNNEEFRVTVADVGGVPTLKVQHYSGVEVESPAWTDIFTLDSTAIRLPGGFVNATDNHNVEAYIDEEIARLEALITGGSGGIVSVTGTNVIAATTDGGGNVTVGVNPNGSNGQSVQMNGGAVEWRDQAVPASARGTANYSGNPTGGAYLMWTNDGNVDRGGMSIAGQNVDLPAAGCYLCTMTFSATCAVAGWVSLQITYNGGGCSIVANGYCTAGGYLTLQCTTMLYVPNGSNQYLQGEIYSGAGMTTVDGLAEATCVRLW